MVLTDSARARFADITDWVFDLDNTLYPRECNLFAQIDMLISHYMVGVTQLPFDEARALRHRRTPDRRVTQPCGQRGVKVRAKAALLVR